MWQGRKWAAEQFAGKFYPVVEGEWENYRCPGGGERKEKDRQLREREREKALNV